jgi:hypothetical protein
MEDVGWDDPTDEDPYAFEASYEVMVGTFTGLGIGVLLGAGAVALALTSTVRAWWLAAVACVLLGTALGGIAGKVVEFRRARRRKARRKKLDEKDAKRKKRPPREVHDDDYRG